MRAHSLVGALALASCAPLPASSGANGAGDPRWVAPLVTTERRSGGAALVFIDEAGRRVADLTVLRGKAVIDRQPAFSPDGKWVVFSSNRDRGAPEATSVWVVEARPKGRLVRLTRGDHVDRDPQWAPDGRSIVFSSDRGGNFDIYRQDVAVSGDSIAADGTPKRLTRTKEQSLAPAVSPDGKWVVFMSVAADGRSKLALVKAQGGSSTPLTRGPTDVTPTFSRDGSTVYFAARAIGRDDSDIFAIGVRGGGKRLVIAEPEADQSGPRLSRDGKVLLATSVYRSRGSGKPVLASVVAAVMGKSPSWRALHDPAFVESRVGVAVAPTPLDRGVLGQNPAYRDGLRRALERALRDAAEQDRERRREH